MAENIPSTNLPDCISESTCECFKKLLVKKPTQNIDKYIQRKFLWVHEIVQTFTKHYNKDLQNKSCNFNTISKEELLNSIKFFKESLDFLLNLLKSTKKVNHNFIYTKFPPQPDILVTDYINIWLKILNNSTELIELVFSEISPCNSRLAYYLHETHMNTLTILLPIFRVCDLC